MGRINCRNPECGFTRSTTAMSTDGEHIPECFGCGDPAYIEPLVEQHDIILMFSDPDDDCRFYKCSCGHEFLIFPEEQARCPKEVDPNDSGATSTSGESGPGTG